MSDGTTSDVRDLASALNEKDNDPTGALKIRVGKVTAVNRANNTYTVSIGGKAIAGIAAYESVWANVNDIVDVLLDGPSPRVLGVMTRPRGVLAYEVLDRAQPTQQYVATPMNAPGSFTATTTDQGTNLYLVGVPVAGNRLLRFAWQIWAAGPNPGTAEWYFNYMVSINGGSYATAGETRYEPGPQSGLNTPSPQGQILYVTPSNATTLALGINVRLSAGTGNVFLYNGTGAPQHSSLSIEDLGAA